MASPLRLSCEFVVEGHVVIFRGNLNRVPAKGILNFNGVLRQGGFQKALPRYTPVLRYQRSFRGSCHATPRYTTLFSSFCGLTVICSMLSPRLVITSFAGSCFDTTSTIFVTVNVPSSLACLNICYGFYLGRIFLVSEVRHAPVCHSDSECVLDGSR